MKQPTRFTQLPLFTALSSCPPSVMQSARPPAQSRHAPSPRTSGTTDPHVPGWTPARCSSKVGGTLEPCPPRSHLSVRAHASCLTTKLNVTATCSALHRISPLFSRPPPQPQARHTHTYTRKRVVYYLLTYVFTAVGLPAPAHQAAWRGSEWA